MIRATYRKHGARVERAPLPVYSTVSESPASRQKVRRSCDRSTETRPHAAAIGRGSGRSAGGRFGRRWLGRGLGLADEVHFNDGAFTGSEDLDRSLGVTAKGDHEIGV